MGVPDVFYSYWFVKSDHLGKVSVGLQSSAGDNAAILVDGSGSLVPANWVTFDNNAMFLRSKNGALSPLQQGSLTVCNVGFGAAGDCVGTPENLVRYDSPAFAGFSVSADWAGHYWDAYARYAGEYNGIKLAAVWLAATGCINSPTVAGTAVFIPPGGGSCCCLAANPAASTATSQAMSATCRPASTSSTWRPVCGRPG